MLVFRDIIILAAGPQENAVDYDALGKSTHDQDNFPVSDIAREISKD